MSIRALLALLSGLFQALAAFLGRLRDQTLVRAGEDRARKEAAEEALRQVRLAKGTDDEVDSMPDARVRAELERLRRKDE